MALHIIDEPTLGGRLGAAVGGGISGLLDNLVKQKAEQVQQARQEEQNRNINKILGLGLSQSPLQNYQSPMAEFEGPQQLQSIASQIQMPHEQQQAALQQATSALQNPAFRKLQEQQQGAQLLQQQQLAKPQAVQQIPAAAQPMIQQPQREPTIKEQLQDVKRRKQALGALNLPLKDVKEAHKMLQDEEASILKQATEQQKRLDKKQERIDKETLPYYKEVKESANAAKESDARLDQMEELLNTGKVQSGNFIGFLESLEGIPVIGRFAKAIQTASTTTETQIFKKLSNDFVKGAKPLFGSNLSTREVELYLETVPNLLQNEEGQRGVIRNFRSLGNLAKRRDQIMDDIIDENGGERPRHLQSEVSKKLEPDVKKLQNDFRDSVKKIRNKKYLITSVRL